MIDTPAIEKLLGELEAYRPTNEWGDPVHHVICDKAVSTIRTLMEAVEEQKAERALLQDILDTRPAINAGLPETYVRWSQAIYSGEIFRAAIRSKGDA